MPPVYKVGGGVMDEIKAIIAQYDEGCVTLGQALVSIVAVGSDLHAKCESGSDVDLDEVGF